MGDGGVIFTCLLFEFRKDEHEAYRSWRQSDRLFQRSPGSSGILSLEKNLEPRDKREGCFRDVAVCGTERRQSSLCEQARQFGDRIGRFLQLFSFQRLAPEGGAQWVTD